MEAPPPLLAVVLALMLAGAALSPTASGKAITVGGKQQWAPNVNYTLWAANQTVYPGDWLVFRWQKGYYDVVQVNETDYERCSPDHPITNWSRGDRWAIELNSTGRWYFICSRGYCWGGMKVSVLVQPIPPPPASAPSPTASAGFRPSAALAAVALAAAILAPLGFGP